MHADHDAKNPSSPAQRRADEANVERFRRALPPSCWSRPPAWSGPAHGLLGP